jgi:formylglycine-generating enzyme required for sulfatase activity
MKARFFKLALLISPLYAAVWAVGPSVLAQTAPGLDIQLYAGLTITGAVGTVYQIQYVTDLAQSNNASAWQCLEFLQLPASPYLWADKSAPATGQRFYRALAFTAPSNMVFIPPGRFRMGSPTNEVDRNDDEGPQTEVAISQGFWMRKYLVTQGEYLALTGTNPSFFTPSRGYSLELTRPVDSVDWYDTVDFCSQFTQQELAAGRIPNNSAYRLATEAEWEYACRALTSTRFSYGDDIGYTNLTNYGWFYDNSGEMTQPVGLKLPNPWGLYDMQGNLEEWCLDWYGPYLGGISTDPQGPATGSLKVLRGGFWNDEGPNLRAAFRNNHDPEAMHYHIGIRLVLAPVQP